MKKKITLPFTPPHILSGLPQNSPVLLAFSGGADSRVLLHLLADYCDKSGAPLMCAHVNHGIRGADALRDRDFCIATAAEYGLKCITADLDIPALAAANKRSLETEAREARYEFFTSVMREYSIPQLATAHNADDCLETLIFNIARGSGLRGICSIPRSRTFPGGIIVRPLLDTAKRDILDFCAENHLDYVTDSTNFDTTISRNLIRHKIIPALEQLNENVRQNASRLYSAAGECCDYIDGEAEKFITRHTCIPAADLDALHPAVSARVLAILCERECGITPEQSHITALSLLVKNNNEDSAASLPGGMRGKIDGGHLVFEPDSREKKDNSHKAFSHELTEDENLLPDGIILRFNAEAPNVPKNAELMLIGRITLPNVPMTARSMREGDTIRHNGMTKKVRRLLSERKIPPAQRYLIPIVTDSEGILWIPGVVLRDGAGCASAQRESKSDSKPASGCVTLEYYSRTKKQ